MGLSNYTTFLKESLILEAVAIWKTYVYRELEKFLPGSNPAESAATGELRANFGGDSAVAEDTILRFFRDHLGFTNAKIEDMGVMNKPKKAYTQYSVSLDGDGKEIKTFKQETAPVGSNSLPTYKVTFDDNTFYITNNGAKGKSIGKKKTTPSELGLADIQFYDASTLATKAIEALQAKAESKLLYQPAADYMIDCVQSVLSGSKDFKPKWANANALLADETNWSRPEVKLSKAHAGLSTSDINDIVNDFGELLDGIFLLNTVTDVKMPGTDTSLQGLTFPKGSNYPLADILLDGIRVSSKAESGGGRPSLQPIIEEIAQITPGAMEAKGISLPEKELALKTMFDHIKDKLKVGQWFDSVEVYIYFAEQLDALRDGENNPVIVNARLKYLKDNIGADLSRPSVIAFLDGMSAKEKETWVEKYWADTKFKAKKAIDYNKDGKDLIATIYYPFAVEVVQWLNDYHGDDLTSLIRRFVSYSQIYLGIDAKQNPDTLVFSGISSVYVPFARFVARASASDWNAGIGFELKR